MLAFRFHKFVSELVIVAKLANVIIRAPYHQTVVSQTVVLAERKTILAERNYKYYQCNG